jgi:hypothetical protein
VLVLAGPFDHLLETVLTGDFEIYIMSEHQKQVLKCKDRGFDILISYLIETS